MFTHFCQDCLGPCLGCWSPSPCLSTGPQRMSSSTVTTGTSVCSCAHFSHLVGLYKFSTVIHYTSIVLFVLFQLSSSASWLGATSVLAPISDQVYSDDADSACRVVRLLLPLGSSPGVSLSYAIHWGYWIPGLHADNFPHSYFQLSSELDRRAIFPDTEKIFLLCDSLHSANFPHLFWPWDCLHKDRPFLPVDPCHHPPHYQRGAHLCLWADHQQVSRETGLCLLQGQSYNDLFQTKFELSTHTISRQN